MINYIKIQKDHDDYNIIVSFSGRDEWSTIQYLIESAYVDKNELAKEDRRFKPIAAEKMFKEICDIGDTIGYE